MPYLGAISRRRVSAVDVISSIVLTYTVVVSSKMYSVKALLDLVFQLTHSPKSSRTNIPGMIYHINVLVIKTVCGS